MANGFTNNTDGRCRVWCRDRTYFSWTRIIARNILGRYLKDDEVVHHIDEYPGNDNHNNLVICTKQYHDSVLHAHSRSGGRPAVTDRSVIDKAIDLYNMGFSQPTITKITGLSQSYISNLVTNKRRNHGG